MTEQKLNTCGCCEGENRLTPADTYNRPGLDSLNFRAGTHAAFFETMIADLAREGLWPEINGEMNTAENKIYPLRNLKTRRRDDFAIALLDAWATIADVLTFYQERIANEGYLRTATERRSIWELARLVGYELRPGVAASTYLAFTVDEGEQPVFIPQGTRAQSVPEPGERMQSFETERDLEARYLYNDMRLRQVQAQFLKKPTDDDPLPNVLYLPGQRTDLRPSDRFLLVFGEKNDDENISNPSYFLARVKDTQLLDQPARAAVILQPDIPQIPESPITRAVYAMSPVGDNVAGKTAVTNSFSNLQDYAQSPISQFYYPGERPYLTKQWSAVIDLIETFGEVPKIRPEDVVGDPGNQDVAFTAVAALNPRFGQNIFTTLGQEPAQLDDGTEALRALVLLPIQARLHGHNAPLTGVTKEDPAGTFSAYSTEWEKDSDNQEEWGGLFSSNRTSTVITLNTVCEQIAGESLLVLEWKQGTGLNQALFRVTKTDTVSTSLFNVPATATRLTLEPINTSDWTPDSMSIIRSTTVYTGSEFITNPVPYRILAEEPIMPTEYITGKDETIKYIASNKKVSELALAAVNGIPLTELENSLDVGLTLSIPIGSELELDGIYDGLKPGCWIAINGMRADIPVEGREVALIQSVEHKFASIPNTNTDLPGDLRHTFIKLAAPLSLPYRRDSIRLNANVVPATHGETARGIPPNERDVIIGSGNAAQAHQRFALKLPPKTGLTYLSAPTRDGVKSTLEVYVNDVRWQSLRTLLNAGPKAQVYTIQTDHEGQTEVIFGDGVEGARLPTGHENVMARYRMGIGKAGNVKAGQISLLATRPAGVREVVNWVEATGGTDPEGQEQARRNVKLSTRTLDRLVGLQDYEDFARTFAGIGKAKAVEGNNGKITVYVAGEDNAPLAGSALLKNLEDALNSHDGSSHDGSDAMITVGVFTPMLITLEATITISSDYLWERMQPAIHTALATTFGFAQRELGQAVALSEVINTIHQVEGVMHVHITHFDALTEEMLLEQATPKQSQANQKNNSISPLLPQSTEEPVKLCYIDPTVPPLIALKEPTEGGNS